jgi:hypothetical protein
LVSDIQAGGGKVVFLQCRFYAFLKGHASVLVFFSSMLFPLNPNPNPDPHFQYETESGFRRAKPMKIHANLDPDTDPDPEKVVYLPDNGTFKYVIKYILYE